jgi:hypothetical protein
MTPRVTGLLRFAPATTRDPATLIEIREEAGQRISGGLLMPRRPVLNYLAQNAEFPQVVGGVPD